MSIKALSEYTFQSRYSQYNHELGRKETWEEAVDRIFDMHREKYSKEIEDSAELSGLIEKARKAQKDKKVMSSQRLLQTGGQMVLDRNERNYNCCGIPVDKPKAFQDVMWLLLAGCGVGFSVQHFDIEKLPKIVKPGKTKKRFVVPDTCEGWADCVGVLLSSYFEDGGFFPEYKNAQVELDYSEIRQKGSLIRGQFKAPGPEPLKNAIEKIRAILETCGEHLKPIEAYDILMHEADAVVSSGLRRSACIALFSPEDTEMAEAKTGDWFVKNAQRGRSNNSTIAVRDVIKFEDYKKIFENQKIYGEPGVVFVDSPTVACNPCAEIQWDLPRTSSKYCTIGMCNLSDINGKYCTTKERFFESCEIASIMGTLQAGYNDFPYLGPDTEEFQKREALIGTSMTGSMDNPEILFDPQILEAGAEIVKETNEIVAKLININPAVRLCTQKPSGHTSLICQAASGIHPHHARRYIRRVQSNKLDPTVDHFKKYNPLAVEESVWSANNSDVSLSFLCEVPKGAIVKNQISALELLEKVKIVQKHWVNAGSRTDLKMPECKVDAHSVSNTVNVREHEWDDVCEFIYKNREHFSGISLLSASGDLNYSQAPLTTVLTPNELVKEYGDASVFASGLVVDGLHAFNNNLWAACDSALGFGEEVADNVEEPQYPKTRNYKDLSKYFEEKELYEEWQLKKDWIRRIKQFSDKYFEGDLRRATYCCKHVSLWKTWVDLQREYQDVDWTQMECGPEYKEADEQAAVACSGGACEIV